MAPRKAPKRIASDSPESDSIVSRDEPETSEAMTKALVDADASKAAAAAALAKAAAQAKELADFKKMQALDDIKRLMLDDKKEKQLEKQRLKEKIEEIKKEATNLENRAKTAFRKWYFEESPDGAVMKSKIIAAYLNVHSTSLRKLVADQKFNELPEICRDNRKGSKDYWRDEVRDTKRSPNSRSYQRSENSADSKMTHSDMSAESEPSIPA
jgi:hypothetical protein